MEESVVNYNACLIGINGGVRKKLFSSYKLFLIGQTLANHNIRPKVIGNDQDLDTQSWCKSLFSMLLPG